MVFLFSSLSCLFLGESGDETRQVSHIGSHICFSLKYAYFFPLLPIHSGADVYDRVSTFLETMYRDMEKGGCGENTIIVSHGLFCRLFLMRYYHWPVSHSMAAISALLPLFVVVFVVVLLYRWKSSINYGTLAIVSML